MGQLIEEGDDFVDDDFEEAADTIDDESDAPLSTVSDERSRMQHYTERRRRIEDLIEAARMRDELGLYDDDLFAS